MHDLPDLSGHQVYACGAPVMVESARNDFVARCGLPADEFYADAFTSEADKHPASTMSDNIKLEPELPNLRRRLLTLAALAGPWAGTRLCTAQADPPDRALPARRAAGHRGARAGREGEGQSRPRGGGKPPRRRWQPRRRPGGQGRARRLDPRHGRRRHACHQPLAVLEDSLRPDPRFHAHHAGGAGAERAGHERRGREEARHPQRRRSGGLREEEPGHAELRLGRQRQCRAPGRRDVQGAGGRVHGAHSLCRRATGATGAAVGPGGPELRQPGRGFGQHQERQAGGAGHDHRQALQRHARGADHRRRRRGLRAWPPSTSTPGSACSARPACRRPPHNA